MADLKAPIQKSNKQYVFHPLLFAINFSSIIIVGNLDYLALDSIALALLITLIATALIWYSLQLIIKNISISAVLISLIVGVFFLYGQIYILILFNGIPIPYSFLCGFFALIFLIMCVAAWKFRNSFQVFTKPLNFVSFILVFSQIIAAGARPLLRNEIGSVKVEPIQIASNATGYGQALPDVYLIVLDAYPRGDVFDGFSEKDSSFEEELEALGFTVTRQSKTNYLYTQGTLPTVLNFNYLPNLLGDNVDSEQTGATYLDALIQDNAVCRTFKEIGYKVVVNNSTWGPTVTSKCADEILSDYNGNIELLNMYINTTMLRPFFVESALNRLQQSRHKAFEHILTVSNMEEPTFMFAHVLLPHTPYVFDENGDLPPVSLGHLTFSMVGNLAANTEDEKQAFADQSIYTGKLTIDTVKQILEESEVPPIIIIMSDHGPDFKFQYNEEYYAQRAPILNAYYLPNGGDESLYPSISPVNIFRVIFNYYFDADLDLLEDRTYVSRFTEDLYYDFQDITTRTIDQNEIVHVGVDWDGQFFEISELNDDKREPMLRIYLETILSERNLSFKLTNNWVAELSLNENIIEIRVVDKENNTLIETQTTIQDTEIAN